MVTNYQRSLRAVDRSILGPNYPENEAEYYFNLLKVSQMEEVSDLNIGLLSNQKDTFAGSDGEYSRSREQTFPMSNRTSVVTDAHILSTNGNDPLIDKDNFLPIYQDEFDFRENDKGKDIPDIVVTHDDFPEITKTDNKTVSL